jgi:hypothetical protein
MGRLIGRKLIGLYLKVLATYARTRMGRSQAVRQRILIPPFGGSIPPAPAI